MKIFVKKYQDRRLSGRGGKFWKDQEELYGGWYGW